MSEARKFLNSIIGYSIPSWIGFFIGIISVPVLTRILSPDQFAIINQFNAAVSLFLGITCLGFDSSFVRYFFELPKNISRNELFSSSIFIGFSVLIILTLITIPFYRSIADFLFAVDSEYVTIFFVFSIFSQIVLRYYSILFRMQNLIIGFSIITIATQLISKFAVLVAIPFKGTEIALIGAISVGLTILSVSILIYDKGNNVSIKRLKPIWLNQEYVKYSIGSWLTPTIIFANIYISQLIIRNLLGNVSLGIYLSANIFASILATLQGGFVNFWSVYMFKYYNLKRDEIKKAHDIVCLFVIFFLSFIIIGKDFIYLLIGEEFHGSKPLFAMVLSAPLFLFISETTSYGISIIKKTHITLYSYLTYFVMNIALSWILTPKYGLLGSAISLMISSLMNFTILSYFGQKYYISISNSWKTILTVTIVLFYSFLNYYSENIYINILIIFLIDLLVIFIFKSRFFTIYRFLKQLSLRN